MNPASHLLTAEGEGESGSVHDDQQELRAKRTKRRSTEERQGSEEGASFGDAAFGDTSAGGDGSDDEEQRSDAPEYARAAAPSAVGSGQQRGSGGGSSAAGEEVHDDGEAEPVEAQEGELNERPDGLDDGEASQRCAAAGGRAAERAVAASASERGGGGCGSQADRRADDDAVGESVSGSDDGGWGSALDSDVEEELSARLMAMATSLQSRGHPKEALSLYEQVLMTNPRDSIALVQKGACFHQMQCLHEAFGCFNTALAQDPMDPKALQHMAELYQQQGLLAEASQVYKRAIAASPGDKELPRRLATALTDLGTRHKALGNTEECRRQYLEALSYHPESAPANFNLGVLAAELGFVEEAMGFYLKAAQLSPTHAETHCNIGILETYRGRNAEAKEAFERCLSLNPGYTLARNNLAIVLCNLATQIKATGQLDEAIRHYERALALKPDYPEALYNTGVAYAEMKQLDKAVFMYELAVHFMPLCAEAWNNLGVLYKELEQVERAVTCYQRAIQAKPSFPQPLNNLGVVCTMQGQGSAALEMLKAAVAASPTYAEAHNNLGVLYRDLGMVHESIAAYEACLALAPDMRNAGQNLLLALNYIRGGEDPEVCTAHAAWGDRFQRLFTPLPPPPPLEEAEEEEAAGEEDEEDAPTEDAAAEDEEVVAAGARVDEAEAGAGEDGGGGGGGAGDNSALGIAEPGRGRRRGRRRRRQQRLTVGYISPDLYTHSVSYFAEAPLTWHDAARVRCIVYSATPKPDERTVHLRAATERAGGEWRDVARLSEEELAAMVRADGVDILVELTGHTANNRLGVLAQRPSPVQVTWIGYPNTTGLRAVDFRLTDATADAPSTHQTYAEQLVRLPGCFLCYTPPLELPPVSASPALAAGFVTFGSFNALSKMTPRVRAAWARILGAVPRARLLVKAKPFACAATRHEFLALLEADGIDRTRVDLQPLLLRTADHLSAYRNMDVSLDTFPYAGTTTTCESLLMGVPCVTLAGCCHAHNVGVSILETVGLDRDGFVARSEEEYVAAAVRAAEDPRRLAETRASLRQRMLRSPLCAAQAFTRRLERAYEQLADQHRTVPPAARAVAAAAAAAADAS